MKAAGRKRLNRCLFSCLAMGGPPQDWAFIKNIRVHVLNFEEKMCMLISEHLIHETLLSINEDDWKAYGKSAA